MGGAFNFRLAMWSSYGRLMTTERGTPAAAPFPLRPVTVNVTLDTVWRRKFDSDAEHWPLVVVTQVPVAPVLVDRLTVTPACGAPEPLSTVAVMVARQRIAF